MKKLCLFLILALFIPSISADVISLNSGGTGNIVLNPDKYIEGFFWCTPTTCAELGYECGNWPDGCGNTLDCGSCAVGYTCSSGTCVIEGGGGGGGGGAAAPSINVEVYPTSFDLHMAINTNIEKTIKVTNVGSSSALVSIYTVGLGNMIMVDQSHVSLAPGASQSVDVVFSAFSETGVFTGQIRIGDETIPVVLNVRTKLLLFDSDIKVLNEDYQVKQGDILKTEVNLIPMTDEDIRLDVTLNYTIKDYQNKIYLTKSETVLIDEKETFNRNFDTGNLPLDEYVIGLVLIYPGGVAPSSAHFSIIEKIPGLFEKIIVVLIILIMLLAIAIIIFIIYRRKKKEKEPRRVV